MSAEKTLFDFAKTKAPRDKARVLRVEIFKRPESRFFQALITFDGYRKRITTRKTDPLSAKQFAELAYHHFNRLAKKGELKK